MSGDEDTPHILVGTKCGVVFIMKAFDDPAVFPSKEAALASARLSWTFENCDWLEAVPTPGATINRP
jgi:hypothetical protein